MLEYKKVSEADMKQDSGTSAAALHHPAGLKGNRHCCKRGLKAPETECAAAPAGVLDKLVEKYGVDRDLCQEFYTACCEEPQT